MLHRLWQHRSLAISLVRRQFQLRYRQSVAGFLWAIVPPLVTVAASTLVFHKVAGIDSGETPYPLFVFAALTPWTFLASSLTGGVTSVASNQAMVSRLAFPRAVLPLSTVGLSLIDMALAGVTFVVFVYVTGNSLPLTSLWFPAILFIEILLTAGIVMLGSALNMFARDIKLAVPVLTQFWLLLTPVMYPLEIVPQSLRPLYLLNPMTGIVEAFRGILIYGDPPSLGVLGPAIAGSVIFLIVGFWYFGATESRFADVI